MTILSTDVKLMASERLTDNDDGGGQMSAVEIEDGVVNNLFPDISRLDRTYGRVNLRKLYLAVRTANQDIYYGSHAIVTDPPDDPRVSTLIFSTESYTDERVNARDRIESYVVKGPVSRYTPLGDQIEGQRTVRLYARTEAPLPEVGNVYLLSEEDSAGNVLAEQQYVRITDVSHEVQTFTDGKGDFTRRVLTLDVSDPLRRTYPGEDTPNRITALNASPTKFRDTAVADAARYYGIVPLEQPIAQGDMTIKCNTIYGQLVPSATVESPVADVRAGSDAANIVASGAAYSINVSILNGTCAFGRPVVPGSVRLGIDTDDKTGNIVDSAGNLKGFIDYTSGILTGLTIGGTIGLTATPGTAISEPAMTTSEEVTLANRGYNYIKTLYPTPQPGTLTVDYMAQGDWYRMYDDGTGQLQDGYGGTATIDFSTGTVIATLGALPDTETSVIYTWATPQHYEERTADPDLQSPYMAFTVSAGELLPNSLNLSWEAGGVTKTATDDGMGNLTGDAEGRVIYSTGEIGFRPLVVPTNGAILTIAYDRGVQQLEQFTDTEYTVDGSHILFTLPNAPIRPGTVSIDYDLSWTWIEVSKDELGEDFFETNAGNAPIRWIDNGDGTLSVERTGEYGETFVQNAGDGVINYSTGEVTVRKSLEHTDDLDVVVFSITSPVQAYYQEDSVVPDEMNETANLPDATIQLLPTVRRMIVPGSLEFTWNSKTYIDREGTIYTDWDRDTGAATAAGSINYTTGVVSLYGYAGGGSNTLNIKTLLARYRAQPAITAIAFRTPGAPLRPSSLYIRAVATDGRVISATADNTGTIDTATMEGTVNYQTGVCEVAFREYIAEANVPDNLISNPDWVSDHDQGDGTYLMGIGIDASSVKFNAVVYSMLPLDADVLGLDPVRLPVDGRVPIIRSGDVVVIHSTQTEALPNPLSAGQSVSLSRDELALVELIDSEGETVDAALYTVDRQAGTVTMADPLDLSAYTQPLQARHRIEDMSLVNEAQINGQITLVGGVSRAYDPADTWVSSALIFGDLGSRVHHLFSQATWTSTWSDERIGNNTTAQYNDLLYPIQVDNKNSIRERWALIFTGNTTFNIVGEVSGVIGNGNTGQDCQPTNPVTGEPYFTLFAAGWGSGWVTNNVLRFNTDAAHAPIWTARTTISGAATHDDDSFKIQARGDSD